MSEFEDPHAEYAELDARLADLRAVGGEELVRRLLGRFEPHLVSLMDTPAEAWSPALAHRTHGLAGMIGFTRLAAACLAIEDARRPDDDLVEEARIAANLALAEVRKRLRFDA